MVIRITPQQQTALGEAQLTVLARRVTGVLISEAGMPNGPDIGPKVAAWLKEGRNNGVETELDLARLCLVLADIDTRGGRPRAVADRLADPEVGGELKVFQVTHAWNEHLSRR